MNEYIKLPDLLKWQITNGFCVKNNDYHAEDTKIQCNNAKNVHRYI